MDGVKAVFLTVMVSVVAMMVAARVVLILVLVVHRFVPPTTPAVWAVSVIVIALPPTPSALTIVVKPVQSIPTADSVKNAPPVAASIKLPAKI